MRTATMPAPWVICCAPISSTSEPVLSRRRRPGDEGEGYSGEVTGAPFALRAAGFALGSGPARSLDYLRPGGLQCERLRAAVRRSCAQLLQQLLSKLRGGAQVHLALLAGVDPQMHVQVGRGQQGRGVLGPFGQLQPGGGKQLAQARVLPLAWVA